MLWDGWLLSPTNSDRLSAAACRASSPGSVRSAAVPNRRILLFPLPGTQCVGGPNGRVSSDHGTLGQSAGNLCGLRYPHVPAGLTPQVDVGSGGFAGNAAAG